MHKSVYGFQMAQYAVNRVFFRAVHFAWKKPSGGFNVKSSVQKASAIPLNVCYNVNKMPFELIMEAFLKSDFSSGLIKDTFHCFSHDLQRQGHLNSPLVIQIW